MKKPISAADFLVSRAEENSHFRERLLATPKATIEREFGVTLSEGHEIHVHEETTTSTHLVLPPRDSLSEAERQEAKTGATSLEFLRRTLHDPAPPARRPARKPSGVRKNAVSADELARAGRGSICRGLGFLETVIDENGAWPCIRFNTADPELPRHFERPPFVSALCVLALESCNEARAKAICTATKAHLADAMEYPGLWRYYRHLPQDLDSTALCSLVLPAHPGFCWGGTCRPCWRTGTRRAVS